MGFGRPADMRRGLLATRAAEATTAGTITVDSYTRVGRVREATGALAAGAGLNGYPLLSHRAATNRAVLRGVAGADFPVQLRHGSPTPGRIVDALIESGMDATEGGPVSYCLPYGRVPLRESVRHWARACERLAGLRRAGGRPHLETFGGCLLGQLCPPSQLVAISVLEAMFFRAHGLSSVSVSYAQQAHPGQDREAVLALRRLCGELLSDLDWHVVIYVYMGLFPESPGGARLLLRRAADLAAGTRSERLIVKTVAEAHRIPTVAENVAALEYAAEQARRATGPVTGAGGDSQVYAEARALVTAVLELHDDLGQALVAAFERGYLDIPFCVHPDNAGRSRARLDADGRLRWARLGGLPLADLVRPCGGGPVSSSELLTALSQVRRSCDRAAAAEAHRAVRVTDSPGEPGRVAVLERADG
jgi:methylaspartate mutase epsilon subunit